LIAAAQLLLRMTKRPCSFRDWMSQPQLASRMATNDFDFAGHKQPASVPSNTRFGTRLFEVRHGRPELYYELARTSRETDIHYRLLFPRK